AEGARTPLHAPLEPADHLAVGDRLGGLAAELGLALRRADHAALAEDILLARGEGRRELAMSEVRAPIGVIHDEAARLAVSSRGHDEGRTDGAARIARRRLDI